MNIVEYGSKAYNMADEQLLKLFVVASAFFSTFMMTTPALANSSTPKGGTGSTPTHEGVLNQMTGYNESQMSLSTKTVTQNTDNLGVATVKVLATGSMVVGFAMLIWGIYSLKNLTNQQAGADEKKKAWVYVIIGALMAVPALIYSVFAYVVKSAVVN